MSESPHPDGKSDHLSSNNKNNNKNCKTERSLLNGNSNSSRPSGPLVDSNELAPEDDGHRITNGHDARRRRPPDHIEAQHEEHARFISALENHGDLHAISRELGWSVDDVQQYAFRYMTELQEQEVHGNGNSDSNGGSQHYEARHHSQHDPGPGESASLPWSLEESVMFDNLIAMYHPASRDTGTAGYGTNRSYLQGGDQGGSWEQVVAAHLPGRSIAQIRQRYRDTYLSRNSNDRANHPR